MKIEYTQDELSEIVKVHTLLLCGSAIADKHIEVSGYGTYTVRITDKEPDPVDEGVGLEV